ncbi:MAG TPA: alkaline phosphatase family protein [Solirubrobacteraceae bacterium]|nr:alkaline phosphatase family protein [Solirubrobacteraceae bacterium]
MQRSIGCRNGLAIAAAGAALALALVPGGAAAHGRGGDATRHHVTRAALPPGAIKHIFVVELENEEASTTFGPASPATYLNQTLVPQGEFLKNYYATGHASLDNYIAQISGQAPTEETGADCGVQSSGTSIIGSYADLLPGTPDPNQTRYPGQVDGHGCIYPANVPTIANQLDAVAPPNRWTHRAAWRAYAEDMGNQTSVREIGASDPTGGLDCAHPPLNGVDNTNSASPATATAPADQYATRHNGFAYFHSIIDNTAECDANVVPLGKVAVGTPSRLDGVRLPDTFSGHLASDLKQESTTPKFAWVTPNLCNDGHDSTCAGPNTIGQTGAGAGGLHGADEFLAHWIPLLEASPAYRSGSMLIVVTFDEGSTADACCGETPGPDNPTPGFSPLLTALYQQFGLPIPNPAPGGGNVGAVLLNTRYIKPGSVDSSGYYNHYSALRSYEDLLGLTRGGTDGLGHLGFASSPGLAPFGRDVFNRSPEQWAPRHGRRG